MRRTVGMLGCALAVLAVGSGPATASGGTPPPDPLDDFLTWALSNGLLLTSTACSTEGVVVCYGLDPASTTVTARVLEGGSFELVTPAAPATTTAIGADLAGGTGTRADPVPVGTPAEIGDGWTLVVNSVTLDGTATVMAENPFNDPPPDGSVYVLVNISATYNGPDEKASPLFWISGVTSANVEIDGLSSFVVAPDAFDSLSDVFAGGSRTGNIVLTVPAAELSSLVLYTSAGFSGDDVYFATV